ncbi:MAG TPA: hypothetical protein VG488_12775 [Candidatus Angelobacter sp.]|jgi:hypothetical protein|nr:hypothetical protein [Candidatus Angelobacter sp.]
MSSPFTPSASGTPASGTSSVCLGNYLATARKFKICGSQAGTIQTVVVLVKPYSYSWSSGWDAGPDKMLTVSAEAIGFSKCFCPFTACANVALYHR